MQWLWKKNSKHSRRGGVFRLSSFVFRPLRGILRSRGQSGFTLVEIMISMGILSIGLLSLYTAQGNSLRASGNAERIQVASMLARQIMTEQMFEIEAGLKKGSFPEDKTEKDGEFDPPYGDYRWEFKVRKVSIPIAGGGGEGGEQEGGAPGSSANQAPAQAQANMAQLISKKLEDEIREINVKVIWEELGEEQSITVTTHVSKL